MEAGTARNKCEQVISEALAMSAEIVLLNRILQQRDLARRPTRTRFNINIDGVDVVRGMMEFWRRDLHLPLRILIVWKPKDNESSPRLLERWDMRFSPSERALTGGEDENRLVAQVKSMYKRLILLLRTLYSQSLLLPTTQVARDLDLARRKNIKTGSLGFAICAQGHDSDEWVLLNGHDSSAYQPNPPLDFEPDNKIGQLVLPKAGCAFGTFSVSASFIRYIRLQTPTTTSASSSMQVHQPQQPQQQQKPDSAAAPQVVASHMRRNQSGLAMMLKKNSDEDEYGEVEAEGTGDARPPRPGMSVEEKSQAQDDEDWKDFVDDYRRQQRQQPSLQSGQSTWGNERDESTTDEEEKDDTPPLLYRGFHRAHSARRASEVAWGNELDDMIENTSPLLFQSASSRRSLESPEVAERSLPSSQSPTGETVAKMRQSAVEPRTPPSPLPRASLGPRQISRSADDRNNGQYLTKRQHQYRRKGKRGKKEIVAPFGYAPDDEDDSPGTSPIVFRKKELVPRPIVSRSPKLHSPASRPSPPTPDTTRSTSSEPRARATRMKTPRSRQHSPQDGGVGGALVRQGRKADVDVADLVTAYSPSSYQNEDDVIISKLLAGSQPSFAYNQGIGSSPNSVGSEGILPNPVLGSSTSPTLVGTARHARLLQQDVSSSSLQQQQQQQQQPQQQQQQSYTSSSFIEESRTTNFDAQTFFSLDGFEDDEQGSAGRRRRTPSGLGGAPPLSMESSPFHLGSLPPPDESKELQAGRFSPTFLDQELGAHSDRGDHLASFTFDVDRHGEDPSTTIVEAVAEMLHVSKDPPHLALDRERPLSLHRLEEELATCRQAYGLSGLHDVSSHRRSTELQQHKPDSNVPSSPNLTKEENRVEEQSATPPESTSVVGHRGEQTGKKSRDLYGDESGAISSSSSFSEKNDSDREVAKTSTGETDSLPDSFREEDLDDAAQPLPQNHDLPSDRQSADTSDIL